MKEPERRNFARNTLKWGGALTLLTLFNAPRLVWGGMAGNPLQVMKENKFLQRDDLADALKSLYMTYDSTTPYPHKFNDVVTKNQLRSLEFFHAKGLLQEYVKHYITMMTPVLRRLKGMVEKQGGTVGIWGIFEDTSAYQVFERINEKEGERSFPCPYKAQLENCKKWLGADNFTFEWKDVHERWCIPVWTGFAKEIGIQIVVQPGETCMVKLA